MTIIESNKSVINKNHLRIYNFLVNLNNWEKLMPDRVINWQSNDTTCTFTIQGTADLGMQLINKDNYYKIILKDYGKVPFPFELFVNINEINPSESEVQFSFNADLNPMLKLMAVNPLKNFLNMLIVKLKELEY